MDRQQTVTCHHLSQCLQQTHSVMMQAEMHSACWGLCSSTPDRCKGEQALLAVGVKAGEVMLSHHPFRRSSVAGWQVPLRAAQCSCGLTVQRCIPASTPGGRSACCAAAWRCAADLQSSQETLCNRLLTQCEANTRNPRLSTDEFTAYWVATDLQAPDLSVHIPGRHAWISAQLNCSGAVLAGSTHQILDPETRGCGAVPDAVPQAS